MAKYKSTNRPHSIKIGKYWKSGKIAYILAVWEQSYI
jgi:hypothetical protein